jgi:hypothetical protein
MVTGTGAAAGSALVGTPAARLSARKYLLDSPLDFELLLLSLDFLNLVPYGVRNNFVVSNASFFVVEYIW